MDANAGNTPGANCFITFEGIDGSGKSTQLRLLASELRLRGREVVTTREPGGTLLGTRLREMLLDTEAEVAPLTELLLYAADRAQHVSTLIRPALADGKVVLSDRYADATIAYQGAGRELPPDLINQVVRIATAGLKPNLTLVFDIDPTEGRTRQRQRAKLEAPTADETASLGNRLDEESLEFHTRVRAAYKEIAQREPVRVRLIDASRSVAETHEQVMTVVLPVLEKRLEAGG